MSNSEWTENNSWLLRRWRALLREAGLDPDARGRKVRVQRLEVTSGRVSAQVTSRESGTHEIEMRWPPLNSAEWGKVINALSEQALYAAQLLAGNFPAAVEKIFADVDLALLPDRLDEWRVLRSPVIDAEANKEGGVDATSRQPVTVEIQNGDHAHSEVIHQELTAIYQMLGQIFVEEPWLLFQLRGRDRQQLLQDLREHRSHHVSESSTAASAIPVAPRRRHSVLRIDGADQQAALEGARGLSEPNGLTDFSGFGLRFKELHHHVEPPAVDLTLLRRLGPPPFVEQSAEAYDVLARIYRQVSEQALALAYAAEPEEADTER